MRYNKEFALGLLHSVFRLLSSVFCLLLALLNACPMKCRAYFIEVLRDLTRGGIQLGSSVFRLLNILGAYFLMTQRDPHSAMPHLRVSLVRVSLVKVPLVKVPLVKVSALQAS